MWTLGLGGDSHIRLIDSGKATIGPRRAIPLCQAGGASPEFSVLLADLAALPEKELKPEDLRWFTLRKRPAGGLSCLEERLLASLESKVMSLAGIRREISPYLDIESLLQRGALMEVGFTPTDLLHCTGDYALWDPAASMAGLHLIALQVGRTTAEMEKTLLGKLDVALSLGVVAKALQEERGLAAMWGERSEQLQPFLAGLLGLDGGPVYAGFRLQVPLIAVGAPAHAHLPAVAERLNCRLIVPRHAEVANAYGAISGKIVETATALIRPATPDGYLVISHNLRRLSVQLEEAVQLAKDHAATEAERILQARGGTAVTVQLREDRTSVPLAAGWGESVLIELRITATATGSPAPLCSSASVPCSAVWLVE